MLKRLKKGLELRQQSATDQVIASIQNGALLPAVSSLTTNAVETAAGIIGRALSSARVTTRSDLITPSVLFAIGRSLIRTGEYVAVRSNGGLIEGSISKVRGTKFDQSDWIYELAFSVPNDRVAKADYSMDEFVFVKYIDGGTRGRSPIDVAATSSELHANITKRLAQELKTPTGYLLPIPARDGGSANVDELRKTIAAMDGRVLTVESAQSLANTAGFTRTSDWTTNRVGANPPPVLAELLKDAYQQTISLCGIPLAIVTQSSQREAWRQFIFGTISPLAKMIAHELQRVIDSEIEFEFDELRASDITGRARAFSSMVQAGMDLSTAAGLSGLLAIDD